MVASLLQGVKVVDGNMSFASANGDNERYRAMFPDSKIAQSYSQAETKVKYMIQFGIAPYICSELLIDLQGSPFCFKFDETTTLQIKKQYDGYVTYYSKNFKRVITIYVGSLFVGHCTASDLLDHFFKFMKDLKLDTDLLLSIEMDGPNVNKSFKTTLVDKLEKEKGSSFISLGSCVLHTVNNGFGKGVQTFKGVLEIEQFLIDLHIF